MWNGEYDMDTDNEESTVLGAGKILGILLAAFSLLGYVLVHADRHTTDEVNIQHMAKTMDEVAKDVKEINAYLRDNPR